MKPPEFDPKQREAIEHVAGPMLVIAGAGTGKTTVLVERIARLIESGAAKPSEILAITYTDNSTAELRARVKYRLRSPAAKEVEVQNFHTYGSQLVRRFGESPGVLDEADLWIFLRQRIAELPLKNFIRAANVSEFLKDFITFFDRCHDELVTPERYDEYLARVERGELPLPRVYPSPKDGEPQPGREEVLARCREISAVFHKVEDMLRAENLWTFSHMIVRAVRALETNPTLLQKEQARARFLLLDEFQDVNYAQIRLARLLAGDEGNIFAVGDPDQAIYYFRGASSAAFAQFLGLYPRSTIVRLVRNHRSLPPILIAAHAVISKNPPLESEQETDAGRKPLFSVRAENEQLSLSAFWEAPPVELLGWKHRSHEAADVARRIDELRRERGTSLSDFAVLYRSHAHREEVVNELAARGIRYSVIGLDALQTPEVRDVLAILRVIQLPSDPVSLFRIAAMPAWEIDPAELRKELNAVPGPEMPRILQKFEGGKKLLSVLEKLRAEAREPNIPVSAVLERALRNFSLPRSTMPARALRDFVVNWEQKPLTKSKSLAEFLRYLEFFGQADGTVPLPVESEDAVRLMTAHAAKGLEFRHVFILRAYSQRFPNGYHETLFDFPAELRAPDSAENADAKQLHKEEERRLFYVAMTRARDSLFLYGRLQGQSATPAGYIRDLFNDLPARGSWRLSTVPEPRFNLTAGTEAEVITPLESWLFAPAELKSGDLTLSSSAITEYQQCPLRYKINREWRLPPESSPAMRFGNAMHKALKFFGESSDSDAARLRDQVLAAFRKALADAYIEDPVQRRLYEEQGVRQLTEFVALHSGAARANIIGTEKDFKANIGGVTVRGRVDRLDRLPTGGVAVIDYKTGSPRTQEDADDALQLSLYALGAERVWGVKPERLVFYNLETNSEVATTRSGKQLADAELSVQNVAAGIAAGIFDPRPGRHCARCTYNAICPAQERRLFHIETTAAGAGRVN